jgi:DNA-binding FadR family transcriptional regulator
MDKVARVNLSKLVAEKLKNNITKGKFKPGNQLPTHEKLCGKWGVSRVTLLKARKVIETKLTPFAVQRGTDEEFVGKAHSGSTKGSVRVRKRE